MTPTTTVLHTPADDTGDEAFVSRWFVDYVDAGRRKPLLLLKQPRRAIRMLRHLHRVPAVTVPATAGDDGAAVRAYLRQPLTARVLLGNAVSALAIPGDPAAYLTGRPKHALRQKVRAADEAGVRYRAVEDLAERAALIARADQHERTGAVASTRNSTASNAHLVPLQYWLLAEDSARQPLLLAVVAVEGDVALLRYYRTLVNDDCSSAARYGAMPQIVAALSAAGVSVLLEGGRPYWTDNGIRQFQRKLGFRIVRVAFGRARRYGREGDAIRAALSTAGRRSATMPTSRVAAPPTAAADRVASGRARSDAPTASTEGTAASRAGEAALKRQ